MTLTNKHWEDVKVRNGGKLVAFMEPYYAHFINIDAKKAAEILGCELDEEVDGQPHLVVDRRVWNPCTEKLAEGGFEVVFLDMPTA